MDVLGKSFGTKEGQEGDCERWMEYGVYFVELGFMKNSIGQQCLKSSLRVCVGGGFFFFFIKFFVVVVVF